MGGRDWGPQAPTLGARSFPKPLGASEQGWRGPLHPPPFWGLGDPVLLWLEVVSPSLPLLGPRTFTHLMFSFSQLTSLFSPFKQ